MYAARAVVPRMLARGGGYLLSTASAAGLLSQPGDAPYSVTKHAAVALAEWLAITYGDQGSWCRACARWRWTPPCSAAAAPARRRRHGCDGRARPRCRDPVARGGGRRGGRGHPRRALPHPPPPRGGHLRAAPRRRPRPLVGGDAPARGVAGRGRAAAPPSTPEPVARWTDDAADATGRDAGLARPLGLAEGDRVRWRDRPVRVGARGGCSAASVTAAWRVRDGRGASRARRPDRLEVAIRGPRGGSGGSPRPARAARTEQLGLWEVRRLCRPGEPAPRAPRPAAVRPLRVTHVTGRLRSRRPGEGGTPGGDDMRYNAARRAVLRHRGPRPHAGGGHRPDRAGHGARPAPAPRAAPPDRGTPTRGERFEDHRPVGCARARVGRATCGCRSPCRAGSRRRR